MGFNQVKDIQQMLTSRFLLCLLIPLHVSAGAHSGVLVEALRYKLEDRGSIPDGVTGFFSLT
jgi:hypothetical protein